MGAAYPELVRAQPLITETLKLEESRFQQTLGRGLQAARGGDRRGSAPAAGAARRGRLQALRHLRLPARPHRRTCCARAGPQVDMRGLRRGDGRASAPGARRPGPARARRRPRRSGSTLREKTRRHRVPGLRHRARRGPDPRRSCSTARRSTVARRRGQAADHRQPDAVLWRDRAARWAIPAVFVGRGRRGRGRRRAEEAGRPARPSRHGREGRARGRRRRGHDASTRPPRASCAPTIRPPICCTRRCAGGSAST